MKKQVIFNDTPYAIAMIAPNILIFFAFLLFPIVWTFVMSLTRYDLISPMEFIGFSNYIGIFRDEVALECLRNTIVFTLITVPSGMVISLFLAVLLDSEIHYKKFYRAAFFLPSITSWVAIAIVWQWLYNPEFGIINFLLFLAGLQSISTEYYEAANLEGASPWQKLIHITIPLLTPTTFFVFVTSVIGAFQTFDIVNLMTNGGPGRSSSLLAHYLYQNAFKYMKMGYSSALAILLFVIIMVVTIINMQFEKKSHKIY